MSRRSAKSSPAQLTFEAFTPEDLRDAIVAFEHHLDPVNGDPGPGAVTGYNYFTVAQAFFEKEAEGERPSGALVDAVLSTLADGYNINGQVTEEKIKGLAANVLGATDGTAIKPSDFIHAGPMPDWIYNELPECLANCCATYDTPHERDLFLIGALGVTASCFPTVRCKYDKWMGINEYYCVVASSGQGKDALSDAERLAVPIDYLLIEESKSARKQWEKAQDDVQLKALSAQAMPPYQQLVFAGDTSGAKLFLGLHANNGNGLVLETELGVLLDTMGKEWGDIRSKLLSAYHNATIKYERKDGEPLRISEPTITMVVSGTHSMFKAFIRGTEDGFFNRFGYYAFSGSREFVNRWSDDEHSDREDAIEQCSAILLAAYQDQHLRERDEKNRIKQIKVRFTEEQKDRQYRVFKEQKEAFQTSGLHAVEAYTHRAAIKPIRIAAALTMLRLAESGAKLRDITHSVECSDKDFGIALRIGLNLMAHGVTLASSDLGLDTSKKTEAKKSKRRKYYEALVAAYGDTAFTAKQAKALVPDLPFGVRTAAGYLADMVELGILIQAKRGEYAISMKGPLVASSLDGTSGNGKSLIGYADPSLIRPEIYGEVTT